MDLVDKYLGEGSKEDAMGALKALISYLGKKKQTGDGAEIEKMAKGIKSYADKNDGKMTPDQAEWVSSVWNSIKRG